MVSDVGHTHAQLSPGCAWPDSSLVMEITGPQPTASALGHTPCTWAGDAQVSQDPQAPGVQEVTGDQGSKAEGMGLRTLLPI